MNTKQLLVCHNCALQIAGHDLHELGLDEQDKFRVPGWWVLTGEEIYREATQCEGCDRDCYGEIMFMVER